MSYKSYCFIIIVIDNKFIFIIIINFCYLFFIYSEKTDFVDGHPGFSHLLEKLKKDIFGIPKNPLTHAPLSEKNWFHYSSKVWDAIKSSSFFHEYDRLLSKHE